MASWTVHVNPLQTKFKTYICSSATLFFVVCTLLTFIPPFLIAYRSEGFWKRFDWYSEQPRVKFKGQLLVLLETLDANEYFAYSTYEKFNELMDGHVNMPFMKFRQEDVNRDGVDDRLELQLKFQLDSAANVHSVVLLLFFDYKLKKYSRFQMESMGYVHGAFPSGGYQFSYVGDLSLVQRSPLRHAGNDLRFNIPVVRSSSIYAEDYELDEILKSYSARNVTTKLTNEYTVWKSGRGPGQPFTINVDVRYPEQIVLYKPGFWHILKWGWIQYLSVLVIFIGIFSYTKTFVFGNQIIVTSVQQPSLKYHSEHSIVATSAFRSDALLLEMCSVWLGMRFDRLRRIAGAFGVMI